MSIELRWLMHTGLVIQKVRGIDEFVDRTLQYRTRDEIEPGYFQWSAWVDVPTVTDSEAKP